jgi:hypothetical protein
LLVRGRRAVTPPDKLLGIRCHLRHIEGEILLSSVAHDCDVRLAGRPYCAKYFLSPGWIVQGGAIDGDDKVSRSQAQA